MYFPRASRLIPGLLALASFGTAQTVQVANGTIQGGKCSRTDSNYFLSIPYARPPVGDLRLKAPQPQVEAYNGILDATTAAPSCIQFSDTFSESNTLSEDWLVLWTCRYVTNLLLILRPAVSTLTFGHPAPQRLNPSCQSRYGSMVASMKREESRTQPMTAAMQQLTL
jgi:hypothetical protein